MKYFVFLFLLMNMCDREKEVASPTPIKDCKSYNLDKRIFKETDTLVYNVCFHQLLPQEQRFSEDELRHFLARQTVAWNQERIYFTLKKVVSGFSYKELGILEDTSDYFPIRKNSVFNFEEYTHLDDPRCINVYIVQNKDQDFLGSAGDFIPDIHCAIQQWTADSKTVAHELGHALGCLHVHEADVTDGYNDETGDQVCDTPSSDNFFHKIDKFCDYNHPKKSHAEVKILSTNIMSYSQDGCRCTITKGQGKKIKKTTQMNKSLYRTLAEIRS